MILPYGDDNIKNGAYPYFTYIFIAINVIAFGYELSLGNDLQGFINRYAATPVDVLAGRNYLSLVTNIFLHGGLAHLAGNLLFLWIFADNVEAVLGNIYYFIFYIAGGIFATYAHILFSATSTTPSLGASGAISAVLGMYIVFFPRSKIKLLFILFLSRFYIPALYFIGIWFATQIFSSIMEIGKEDNMAGVAWWAHIGGFVFGALIALIIKKYKLINLNNFYTTSRA